MDVASTVPLAVASTKTMLRLSTMNECPETLPYLRPQRKLLHDRQPPSFLKKSLQGYFNDRIEDRVKTDPNLADVKTKPNLYSVSIEEILAKQQISCLNTKLTDARHDWALKKASMDERWVNVKKKEAKLNESIPQFNHYYKDLVARRERAKQRLVQENVEIQAKERLVRMKQKELEALKGIRDNEEKRLSRYDIFKSYLQQTRDQSTGEFGDVNELIDRFNSLENARETLTNSTKNYRDVVSMRQREMDNDFVMKSTEILIYRNYLSEMLEYDTVLREKVFWLEDGLTRIKVTAAQRTLVIGQIKMAIHNLYRQICSVLHRHATIKPEDTLGQLVDIRISVVELAKLSHDIRRMIKAAHMSAKEEAEALAKAEKIRRVKEERKRRLDTMMNKTKKNMYESFKISPRKSQQTNISKLFLPPK